MEKGQAISKANEVVRMFLEHQKSPELNGPTATDIGKKHAEFITALHETLIAYYEKLKDD